ncbi:hypothetical protein [Paludisphaera rhizosphaerae]|uniref:hypothetical protein n=1 Tax=Paludisphaera rhizosphaerae TaxID=2711216 RepID=UPI0013EBC3E4|nr:hypothetical protein [Paludisphaera rhizosphaerae]
MILYHGTMSSHREAIEREGLQPRAVTKRRSNWKGAIRSKRGFVYLTDAYPVYFALAAAKGRDDLLIAKVEVDETHLYPDEDFIAYAMSCGQASVDPADHQPLWQESLTRNGVACTPSISAERILDCRVICRKSIQVILATGGDAQPTPLNYRVMGGFYRRCIERLFEGGSDAALEEAKRYWSQRA